MSTYLEESVSQKEFQCADDKPNIFLIGDSIRMGYCKTAQAAMEGKANVFFVEDNCRNTQYVMTQIGRWCSKFSDPCKVDVVQFNCGHWDVAHWRGMDLPMTSPEEYRKNIGILIRLIRQEFVNAKIIFATTTPMNPNGIVGRNPRTNAQIDLYNQIASEVCAEYGVPVSDLNAFCRGWGSDAYADYCHLTRESFALLGEEVARRLSAFLNL